MEFPACTPVSILGLVNFAHLGFCKPYDKLHSEPQDVQAATEILSEVIYWFVSLIRDGSYREFSASMPNKISYASLKLQKNREQVFISAFCLSVNSAQCFSHCMEGPIFISSICFWFARMTDPGAGYGRCWNNGPVAVESAALGWAPSIPAFQPPLGASE